jgi:hypothetical protein
MTQINKEYCLQLFRKICTLLFAFWMSQGYQPKGKVRIGWTTPTETDQQ